MIRPANGLYCAEVAYKLVKRHFARHSGYDRMPCPRNGSLAIFDDVRFVLSGGQTPTRKLTIASRFVAQ